MPHLARITIYPVKSLPGADVPEAVVLPGGAIEHDRRFAMFDDGGWFFNGKASLLIHQVRSSYDPATRVLTLGVRGRDGDGERSFHLDDDRPALDRWLSDHFGRTLTVREDPDGGFPDDTEAPGPTVVADATLAAVASWFEGVGLDDCRARFRANLEVGGVAPFWDDRLYAEAGRAVRFRVGGVVFEGVNPCQRCPVPARSPITGEPIRGFSKRFSDLREATLPPWASASRFDHFYRLAVNTRRPAPGPGPNVIRVGDGVEILGVTPSN